MIKELKGPRILLISQWPDVKNGEYELIEKIRRTSYDITVVDRHGFTVADKLNYRSVDDHDYLKYTICKAK